MLFYIYMEKIALKAKDATALDFYLSRSKKATCSGVIQISHGMAEHKDRYFEFINFFNTEGYHVVIHDHRGHGSRVLDKKVGHFADQDGWNKVVDDMLLIHAELKIIFPSIPKVLLGHSMGSWIAMSVLQQNAHYDAVLLSGSGYPNATESFIQKVFLGIEIIRLGKGGYSKPLHQLIFGGFNARFKDTLTSSDWLSRDRKSVKNYIDDPLCGFVVSNKLWSDMMHGIQRVFSNANLSQMCKKTPILIFSGSCDPVGGMGKNVRKLKKCFDENNLKSVLYIVDGARHETLNEIDKITTYNYILGFLEKHL
jgi:alpha-beta hydrolase superfamily lysophospholipase